MATSTIKNPLNPIMLTTSVNSLGATGSIYAYKIGRLVFVTGVIRPIATGTDLTLATVYGASVINNQMKAQIGGYNNISQEMNFIKEGDNTNLIVNTTAQNQDLKVNACFISEK